VVLSLTNSVFVTGQGINNDIAAVNRQASAPDIAAYGLLEDVLSDPNISDTAVLDAMGDRSLALSKLPLYSISITHSGDAPDFTTYDVGDTIVVNIPEESISNAQYRVKKRTIDIDKAGQITVQLDLLLI